MQRGNAKQFFLILILSFSLLNHVCAQPAPDDQDADGSITNDTDPGDPGDDPDKLPIDSNIFILVAVGVGYGLKKVYDFKKKEAVSKSIMG